MVRPADIDDILIKNSSSGNVSIPFLAGLVQNEIVCGHFMAMAEEIYFATVGITISNTFPCYKFDRKHLQINLKRCFCNRNCYVQYCWQWLTTCWWSGMRVNRWSKWYLRSLPQRTLLLPQFTSPIQNIKLFIGINLICLTLHDKGFVPSAFSMVRGSISVLTEYHMLLTKLYNYPNAYITAVAVFWYLVSLYRTDQSLYECLCIKKLPDQCSEASWAPRFIESSRFYVWYYFSYTLHLYFV